jgi:flagellar basal-body rod protein FlgG
MLTQGDSEVTENPLDLLIQGEGFFQVTRPDGSQAYLRDGALRLDANGRLVSAGGYVLEPEISVPADAISLAVTEDGRIFVEQAGTPGSTEIGQILLARFTNPAGLTAEGQNLYRETAASGEAQLSTPGELGVGHIIQGALERSNVQVVEEMIHMILAQRAFEVNSKAIESADQMMRTAVNMRPA